METIAEIDFVYSMAIPLVEFSREGYKIRKFVG